LPDEQAFIRDAFKFLDQPSFLLRVANSIGRPLEMALDSLPAKHQKIIHRASTKALKKGLMVVRKTVKMPEEPERSFAERQEKSRKMGKWHSVASFGVGAAGGLFGIFALPLELPASTSIMLRSIASIAQECGMDLDDPEVQLECLYVLSLGSPKKGPESAMSSAYWTSRTAFSQIVSQAASFMAGKSAPEIIAAVEKGSAPVLIRLLTQISAKFEVVVSEKFIAEALPVMGAIGGGMINAAFTDYFSEAARFHFGLRALEFRFGRDTIEKIYNQRIP
jgi:hypothetical protein